MSSRQTPSSPEIPAIVHALGGSVGSAVALLLLYPLERTRIEVQAVVARLEAKEKAATTDDTNDATLFDETGRSSQQIEYEDDNHHHDDDCNNPNLLACLARLWERGELYKGAGPVTSVLAISNFIFFFLNAFVKRQLQGPDRKQTIPPHLSLLASCLAGSVNVLLTNPLWTTNLRILTQQCTYPSLWKELLHVACTLGPRHLWHGTAASLLLVSNPVIQFFCYERVKAWRLAHWRSSSSSGGHFRRRVPPEDRPHNLSALEAFALGALAKGVATVVTYPLQLAQAVLRLQLQRVPVQTGDDDDDDHSTRASLAPTGILHCLVRIYARDGWRGLYTGMNAKLLQTVLTAAFTFLTYEQILSAVYAVHCRLVGGADRLTGTRGTGAVT